MPRTAAELETTCLHVSRVSLSLLMSNFAQALNADAIMLYDASPQTGEVCGRLWLRSPVHDGFSQNRT